jgi:hypothetical protein
MALRQRWTLEEPIPWDPTGLVTELWALDIVREGMRWTTRPLGS